MNFKLSNVAQSQKFFCDVKSDMYDAVNDSAKGSSWMRAAGPIIATGSALITLSARVATIGEILVKGLANIFGSPISKNCSVLKGLKQLFVQLPIHFTALALSPIQMVVGGLVTTFGMAVSPEGYSESQQKRYMEKSGEFEALITKKRVQVKIPNLNCGGVAYTEVPTPDCNSLKYIMYG
jgi:hypothetical protein